MPRELSLATKPQHLCYSAEANYQDPRDPSHPRGSTCSLLNTACKPLRTPASYFTAAPAACHRLQMPCILARELSCSTAHTLLGKHMLAAVQSV